jgi:hypothetical protein
VALPCGASLKENNDNILLVFLQNVYFELQWMKVTVVTCPSICQESRATPDGSTLLSIPTSVMQVHGWGAGVGQ